MKSEITVVHAADLHLGHRYQNLSAEVRERLIADEPEALGRLVSLCIEVGAAALILSGDTFDSVRPEKDTLNHFLDAVRLLSAHGIEIFIAPGNHDPLWPDSPWYTVDFPPGVYVFGQRLSHFVSRRGQVDFFGIGFSGRSEKAFFPAKVLPVPDPQRLSILVVHGETVPDGGNGRYRPITRRVLESLPYDYTALGHVHEPSVKTALPADVSYAYSGCFIGRGFDEPGPRGALVVRLKKTIERPLYTDTQPFVRLSRAVSFASLCRYAFFTAEYVGRGEPFEPIALQKMLAAKAKAFGISLSDAIVRLKLIGDNGGERPSLPYLSSELGRHCLSLSLMDQSRTDDEESRQNEHGLYGAFLRRSYTVQSREPRRILARELGLSAFSGPLDLDRYFEVDT